MPQLLEGKTAIILGVANKWSLAYAIAQAFRREGAKLLLTYQGERVKETVTELGNALGAAAVFECDVTNDDHLARLAETVAPHGRLDAMVHSVAFANREDLSRPFVETSRAGYLLAQEVSAYSMVAAARATAPLMAPQGGSMMTLTYLGSTRVMTNYNVMGVAKAALEASVRYLASELGPAGIRVNAISAGPVKTTSARGVKDLSKMMEAVAARSPFRRNCDPAEVADAAVFLASDLGRGVTGNTLFVDGGYQLMG
jgi:enoyl-[acyl-carrier protein] reductase I